MIWRFKEAMLERKLRKKCGCHEVVRKGHWRYYRNEKHTRIKPCIVAYDGRH
jgi:hypothetical protein